MEPAATGYPVRMTTFSPFLPPVRRLERDDRLDGVVSGVDTLAERVADSPAGPALRGEWLGHALHPLLTDFPLGCWLSAGVLDLVGGSSSRKAAQRLVGLGVAMVPVTAAAGAADYRNIGERGAKRIGAVHAVGKTVVAMLYLMSWRHRRKGHHARGVLLALIGGGLAWVTGYLGGHLSFGKGASVEERGDHARMGGVSPVTRGDMGEPVSPADTMFGQMEGVEAPIDA